MIGSLFDNLFGCSHRRLTRPITPVSKPGEPGGETYVVCLDCGKQFSYDWDHMRIGPPIGRSTDGGVLHPNMPGSTKVKLKYALLGSAIPLAFLVGGALFNKRHRTQTSEPAAPDEPQAASSSAGAPGEYIALPHGGPGASFPVRDLVEHIKASGRDFIIAGQVDCALADHPRPSSLDCWLRENFAKNKESKQATGEVLEALAATGLFEESRDLVCPDTGQRSRGLKLRSS